jgi:hypothetical protein
MRLREYIYLRVCALVHHSEPDVDAVIFTSVRSFLPFRRNCLSCDAVAAFFADVARLFLPVAVFGIAEIR